MSCGPNVSCILATEAAVPTTSNIIHNVSLFLQINASFPGKPINKYSGYVYDGVWLYALALDRLIKEVR